MGTAFLAAILGGLLLLRLLEGRRRQAVRSDGQQA
jgi:hypothetical protein